MAAVRIKFWRTDCDWLPSPTMLVDWRTWTPQIRATLCFVRRGNEVLLIRKKRGFGAGKINGPGGKIEPGEEARDAAIRETVEEVGIRPLDPEKKGELFFHFADGLRLHCTVFHAARFEGEPIETDEAIPFWASIDAIAYEEMWEDDRFWLPQMLEGNCFRGYFTFDGERMLSREVELLESIL